MTKTNRVLDAGPIITLITCTCAVHSGVAYLCPEHWQLIQAQTKEVKDDGISDHHLQHQRPDSSDVDSSGDGGDPK